MSHQIGETRQEGKQEEHLKRRGTKEGEGVTHVGNRGRLARRVSDGGGELDSSPRRRRAWQLAQAVVASCVQEAFRVWYTWANWAKKGVGPYLNIAPHVWILVCSYRFKKQAWIHISGVSDAYLVRTRYTIHSKAAVSKLTSSSEIAAIFPS
jgi:hypothetical protein